MTLDQPHERAALTSADPTADRLAQLKHLIPEAFSEGQIDFDKLRAALGDQVDEREDRFRFTWAGKQDAIRLLQTPTNATLLPQPDQSVNFNASQNLFIEGDNLEVLKLLYKPYFGRVKMIYIDPPYNTGNDFVYPDNFADPLDTYLKLTGQRDADGNLLSSNTDTSGRFHSNWLSMIYPRLFLARQLLRDDGVIFVSIDDNEVAHLRLLMNEVFGEENFIATVIWQKVFAPKNAAKYFSDDHEFIVIYTKNAEIWRPYLLPRSDEATSRYKNPDNDPRGRWASDNLLVSLTSGQRGRQFQKTGESANLYEVTSPGGQTFTPPSGNCWRYSKKRFKELDKDNRIWWGEDGNNMPRYKRFLSEVKDGVIPQTLWEYEDVGHTQEASKEIKTIFDDAENSAFPTPKPTRLMKRVLQVATGGEEEEIVLDFFAGSSSLAEAVLKLNREDGGHRKFIMVQLPEPITRPIHTKNGRNLTTIADIGRERIRRVIQKMEAEDDGKMDLSTGETPEDLGFKVFKLAPSHFRPWTGAAQPSAEALTAQMALYRDPLPENWQTGAVITELALKEGFPLTSPVVSQTVAGHQVFKLTHPHTQNSLHLCLEDSIGANIAAELGLARDDRLICRDVALDDSLAANLALQCRLKLI